MSISGGTVTVQTVDGTVKWSLSGNTTFQCNGSNTFYLTTSPSGTTWPPTVTITSTNCAASPCYPNCPPPPTCANCNNTGKTIAPCWTFTVGGVTGGASGCTGFNTTYYLSQIGSCSFSNCLGGGNSVIPSVTMVAQGNTWVLTIDNAVYTAPVAGFDCQSCNTFKLKGVTSFGASGINSCTGWPATLNVCPSSNCPANQNCFCGCTDTLPDQYEVTVEGITQEWCFANKQLDCTWANGTFVLVYNGPLTQPGTWGLVLPPPTQGSNLTNYIQMSVTCTTDPNTLMLTRRWYLVFASVFPSPGTGTSAAGYLYYQYLETVPPFAPSNPCGGEKTLSIFQGGLYCNLNPLELSCPGAPGSVTINPV